MPFACILPELANHSISGLELDLRGEKYAKKTPRFAARLFYPDPAKAGDEPITVIGWRGKAEPQLPLFSPKPPA